MLEADTLLIGRVTYESFAEAWRARSGEFADKMNTMPKHVVSATCRTQPNLELLGSGRRLFPETPTKTVLRLADTQIFNSGVVVNTYHPAP